MSCSALNRFRLIRISFPQPLESERNNWTSSWSAGSLPDTFGLTSGKTSAPVLNGRSRKKAQMRVHRLGGGECACCRWRCADGICPNGYRRTLRGRDFFHPMSSFCLTYVKLLCMQNLRYGFLNEKSSKQLLLGVPARATAFTGRQLLPGKANYLWCLRAKNYLTGQGRCDLCRTPAARRERF